MKRIGQRTLEFSAPPTVLGHAAIGGKKEAQGPLGQDFDQTFQDTSLQMESWEKAEAQLQKEAVALAIEKSGMTAQQMDMIFAGDLLNQCISSTFGLLDFQIPFWPVWSLLHYGGSHEPGSHGRGCRIRGSICFPLRDIRD